jgi:hypothetical protein
LEGGGGLDERRRERKERSRTKKERGRRRRGRVSTKRSVFSINATGEGSGDGGRRHRRR